MNEINYEYNMKLSNECALGDLKEVKKLVKKGADIFFDNTSSLRIAAQGNHFEIVKFLVNKGAKIQANNYEALAWACIVENLEMVKFFVVDNNVDINRLLGYNGLSKEIEEWANNYKSSNELKNKFETELINKPKEIVKRKI